MCLLPPKSVILNRLRTSVLTPVVKECVLSFTSLTMSMNTVSTVNSGSDKRLPETTVQTVAQNLTTIQNVQGMQNIPSVVQSNIQNIPTQTLIGSVGTSSSLVGKAVSLDMNPKLSLVKPVIPSSATSSTETNKITTLCSIGSTVKIISQGILSTERPNQPQVQQLTQQTVSMPATYHVPRGPATVANIAAPNRSTVATPIVRTNTGQTVSTTKPSNIPISNPQWQSKPTSIVHTQPQKHLTVPVGRVSRPSPAVYTPRLVTSTNQARSVQAAMVTSSSSRLVTSMQTNSNITRVPVAQNRPSTPQVVAVSQTSQPGRSSTQAIQPSQPNRPLTTTGTTKRITVSTPIETANRINTAAPVTIGSVEPMAGRQLSINTATGPPTSAVSHIVMATQHVNVQQQQGVPRIVHTVTSFSGLNTASQVITTSTNTQSSAMRILQTVPTVPTNSPVAKITGMSLHSLPIVPVRTAPAPAKVAATQPQNIGQTVQVKPAQTASNIRVSSTNNSTATSSGQPAQGQYIHPPHTTTTYYSFETPGTYPQFRQASVQPVRLVVEPGYEEPHGKPNASPRPSILRKRDHDTSPVKGAAKNLVPVLASLPSSRSMSSPPCSPKGDQDGGCQSSGSTTVSATSSPGLDEEPEQSRITINPTVEMSPRKKPRKQQLISVEITEPRCTEEEMQFITMEKVKLKELKKELEEKEKRQATNMQGDVKSSTQQTDVTIRTRPMPSLLGSSWKNKWTVRLHHYRRPSDVRPREERRPTVAELAQQKYVLQKLNGWKIYHLTTQMEDIADLEKQVHEKLKTTLLLLESGQQTIKSRHSDGLERVNELIKGNMQRSSLISEGMNEARAQLVAVFQHKATITELLQRCGAGDARHIVKTLASSYTHPDQNITYHVIEPTLEQVARSILLLSVCLERELGLQEATRYYLEILGNTLLRPATAKYLAKCAKQLIDVPTRSIECPWLSLEKFKHKDRDNLECIFKFWARATCEGVPIVSYWDRRIRKLLQTRYDYREGVFDWDYYMVLKPRCITNLAVQEYRFWRNNGIAFTWLEGDPARSNPTLLNNIIKFGSGFIHYAYLGDIVNGPFFTWAATEKKEDKKFRATDIAEREIMRAIHEIRTKEPLCENYVGAHRDASILNGILVNEMPDVEMENESWTNTGNKFKLDKEKISWVEIPNHKVIFHPATSLESLKSKCEYVNKFHLIWIAHNMTKQLANLVPLAMTSAPVIVELRRYMADLRKEDLQNFNKELKEIAQKSGLHSLCDFDSNEHTLARFYKN